MISLTVGVPHLMHCPDDSATSLWTYQRWPSHLETLAIEIHAVGLKHCTLVCAVGPSVQPDCPAQLNREVSGLHSCATSQALPIWLCRLCCHDTAARGGAIFAQGRIQHALPPYEQLLPHSDLLPTHTYTFYITQQ